MKDYAAVPNTETYPEILPAELGTMTIDAGAALVSM